MTDSLVHLVVALDAEAKPLISWFGLKRQQPDRGFPVFRHAHIALVVSGPGKANAAAATAHLHAVCGFPRDALWINVGVAGHRNHEVGATFVSHAVDDAASDRSWYPPLAITPPWPSARVVTLDRADLAYEFADLVDMEAAGFYPTACRFSTSELVQAVKIVSDNLATPAHTLKPRDITSLVGRQLDALDLFLHRLGRLANELAEEQPLDEADLAPYLKRWRFTVSERRQLEEELRRRLILQPTGFPPDRLQQLSSAADVIAFLRQANDIPGLSVK